MVAGCHRRFSLYLSSANGSMFERSSDAVAELRGGAAPLSVLLCFGGGGGLPPARHGPRPRRRHKLRRTSGDLLDSCGGIHF